MASELVDCADQFIDEPDLRIIETVEQLDALPELSIVGLNMGDGNLFAIQKDSGWMAVAAVFPLEPDEIAAAIEEFGPARLLYHPERDR
ncbi:hypothetical protein A5742_16410 [Mycolicibacterium fortuitum]|uniref:Uncharacterized protein n=1 Tax=Mycolicibacterium fortuitum TaxID=1766 RepID=A0ABD6QUI7_MYCFO|nr:hypothetical protein A5742_16410 [Mycolicibacterium fortuitum]